MNTKLLENYIKDYKLNFDKVNTKEIYKWKAVKCFQENWMIDTDNFYEMITVSLSKTKNLLDSGKYFPSRMIIVYARYRPEEVRKLFADLFNEDNDLYRRVEQFKTRINEINFELFENKRNSYQDYRAIVVYLVLRYPERYYFYKFQMFKMLSQKLDLSYKPRIGHVQNLGYFNNICDIIRIQLSLDNELINLHKTRLTPECYDDENLNILTQDFVYAIVNHLEEVNTLSKGIALQGIVEQVFSNQISVEENTPSFKGKVIDFYQREMEKKRIGELGELWVIKYEIEKLKKANKGKLISKIKHTSKEEGDGTGYDIQSFDDDGNVIFIEVKTTKGARNNDFFITRTELERSKIEKNNYYTYRLYNYNEQSCSANLLIIQGELTYLCKAPETYKVSLSAFENH